MCLRDATVGFVIAAPAVILLSDFLIWWLIDETATISNVVRCWARKSVWPEFIYVIFVTILYLHLFRAWPEGRE